MDVFSTQANDFHKLTSIGTESSMFDVCRNPEPAFAMILSNK